MPEPYQGRRTADPSALQPKSHKEAEAAGTFPKRLRIGANRVAWLRDEVNDWLSSKMEGRDDE